MLDFFLLRRGVIFLGQCCIWRQKAAFAFEVARPCPNILTEVTSLRRRVFVGEKERKSTLTEEEGICGGKKNRRGGRSCEGLLLQ